MQQWGMKMAERMGTKIVKKMDLHRLTYRHVRAVLVTIVKTRSNNDSQDSGGNNNGGGGGGGGNTARKVGGATNRSCQRVCRCEARCM